jgi:hypothetical protein
MSHVMYHVEDSYAGYLCCLKLVRAEVYFVSDSQY